ncbi:RNA polymerase sigma factor SigE [Demequina capsici]|uniref:RNA polymerase sigma factor SigE n=1 Tax=Demequina capsici TaxID=3075620 RepID=A0AA96J7F1_9MICO|nr:MULTISPECIES: RNA polymerase sigma factor SigE [unclassified Demequina]WNM25122.1 RNA polymerase sigma factor SigE [Demequina sp. OYTSA14]WNM28028.1 RNA polymerase sigma factor SigE [Demequina sp. PMTSA13]
MTTATTPASIDDVQTLPAELTWERIVEEHSGRVYRLAYHLTGNQHDAEDLTQDVFVRVFNSLSQYKPGTFEGWLHRITTNLFLDRMRRKKRIRFDFMADDDSSVATSDSFDRHERSGQPEDAFDMTNLGDDIVAALAELQPEYRAAVVLSDIEGLSYEEIAATLGIKMGTVRSRLSRARAKLRESLAHRAPVRGDE